jgi:hypothetical protein
MCKVLHRFLHLCKSYNCADLHLKEMFCANQVNNLKYINLYYIYFTISHSIENYKNHLLNFTNNIDYNMY